MMLILEPQLTPIQFDLFITLSLPITAFAHMYFIFYSIFSYQAAAINTKTLG